ncbi:hypothetical protein HRR90_003641 [Exophiala dermatitidis]|nr:hypothetical protein HRR74_005547 [Exophiala dermatitidis]KAJ4548666.1 hypothetical protein HRR76_001255 [Exophiala dermatitidis]KAJ4552614.1 hypothetical protein HRR77_002615 [Exophiala dermatitidis]KAJ4567115.1 hypothetical protein HRR81_007191 [Exophiala dermatitidis]KAJ4596189.1 hypothetical protein HRR84_005310 [Exophiala dermatitidis]
MDKLRSSSDMSKPEAVLPWRQGELRRGESGLVTITMAEYESLLQSKRDLLVARRALANAGIDVGSLSLGATNDNQPVPAASTALSPMRRWASSRVAAKKPAEWPPVKRSRIWEWRQQTTEPNSDGPGVSRAPTMNQDEAKRSVGPEGSFRPKKGPSPKTADDHDDNEEVDEQGAAATEKRSLRLSGLAPETTLLDIVKAIRGGTILHMKLAADANMALLSFVEPAAAEALFARATANKIFIKNRLIAASWERRQREINKGTAYHMENSGATRNLLIRRVRPNMTPETVKLDLKHIYGLEIIDISMRDGNIYVSLNSLGLAVTAKCCLLSRVEYRMLAIEYQPDECAQPWSSITATDATASKKTSAQTKPAEAGFRNRFDTLGDGMWRSSRA